MVYLYDNDYAEVKDISKIDNAKNYVDFVMTAVLMNNYQVS